MPRERVKEYYDIECDVIATTQDAVLLAFGEGPLRQAWAPRSVIRDGSEVEKEDDITVEVEQWFCERNDFPCPKK